MVIEAVLFMFISAMLELTQKYSAHNHPLSFTLALIALILLIMISCALPLHYFKYRKDGEVKSEYFGELYEGTKDTKWAKLNMSFFVIRRLITAFVLVVFRTVNLYFR